MSRPNNEAKNRDDTVIRLRLRVTSTPKIASKPADKGASMPNASAVKIANKVATAVFMTRKPI